MERLENYMDWGTHKTAIYKGMLVACIDRTYLLISSEEIDIYDTEIISDMDYLIGYCVPEWEADRFDQIISFADVLSNPSIM